MWICVFSVSTDCILCDISSMFYAFQAWASIYWRGVCLAHRQGHFLVYRYSHVALDAGTSTQPKRLQMVQKRRFSLPIRPSSSIKHRGWIFACLVLNSHVVAFTQIQGGSFSEDPLGHVHDGCNGNMEIGENFTGLFGNFDNVEASHDDAHYGFSLFQRSWCIVLAAGSVASYTDQFVDAIWPLTSSGERNLTAAADLDPDVLRQRWLDIGARNGIPRPIGVSTYVIHRLPQVRIATPPFELTLARFDLMVSQERSKHTGQNCRWRPGDYIFAIRQWHSHARGPEYQVPISSYNMDWKLVLPPLYQELSKSPLLLMRMRLRCCLGQLFQVGRAGCIYGTGSDWDTAFHRTVSSAFWSMDAFTVRHMKNYAFRLVSLCKSPLSLRMPRITMEYPGERPNWWWVSCVMAVHQVQVTSSGLQQQYMTLTRQEFPMIVEMRLSLGDGRILRCGLCTSYTLLDVPGARHGKPYRMLGCCILILMGCML